MIVREIKSMPELLDDFDWFNDYSDTRRWLLRIGGHDDLIRRLDEGHAAWLRTQLQSHSPRR